MAELADALDSGSSRGNSVQVQVLLSALKERHTKRCAFSFNQVIIQDLNRRIFSLRKCFGEAFLEKMCEAGTEIRKDFGRRTPKELLCNSLSSPVIK